MLKQNFTLTLIVAPSALEGQANASTPYHYKIYDSSPLQDISYYRIKQTDFDGKTTYSQIDAVSFGPANERNIIRRVNLLGENVDKYPRGIVILVYDDGSATKMVK